MLFVIATLGILLALVSLLLLLKPVDSLRLARIWFVTRSFQYSIAALSLLLAAAFYYGAAATRFPAAYSVFALFSAVGAVMCACLLPSQFRAIVEWELELFSSYTNVLAIMYPFCSGFILYSVL